MLPRELADPFLGRSVLGHYRIEKPLGRGGSGTVYRLRHEWLPETYAAIKILTGPGALDLGQRFAQEAKVSAALGGAAVRPIDFGRFDDGAQYIVMEYVPGENLAEQLARTGAMAIAIAIDLVRQVAEKMVAAHGRQIVHRDLKPSNIMLLDEEGAPLTVKLLDFGAARVTGELKLAHTGQFTAIGTLGYMPPEALMGSPVDGRADVFALGVILYQLMTGEIPFPEPTPELALRRMLEGPPPPIAARRPANLEPVPAAVERIVARALAERAAERFTMVELHAALVDASKELPGSNTDVATPQLAIALQEQGATEPRQEMPEAALTARPLPGAVSSLAITIGVALAIAVAIVAGTLLSVELQTAWPG